MSATLTQGTTVASLDSTTSNATSSAAGYMSSTDKAKLDTLQSGTATLSSGTVTISTANITASSRIIVSYKTPGGTLGAALSVPSGSRSNGTPGSFVIRAVDTAGSVVTTDTSTVDWMILG